jgi:hypothetical protein
LGKETMMALRDRIGTLRTRHAEIDEAIRTENARPHPDEGHLADLKRQKLRLKDQIALMAQGNPPPDQAQL